MYVCMYVCIWTCVCMYMDVCLVPLHAVKYLFGSSYSFEQWIKIHKGTTDVSRMRGPFICNLNFQRLPLHLTCSLRIFTYNQFIPSPWLLAIWYDLVWSKSAATRASLATACNQATLLAWLKVMLTRRTTCEAKQVVTWRDFFQDMSNMSSRPWPWLFMNHSSRLRCSEMFFFDHGNLLPKIATKHTYVCLLRALLEPMPAGILQVWSIKCASCDRNGSWSWHHKCQFKLWLTRHSFEFQVYELSSNNVTMLLEATETYWNLLSIMADAGDDDRSHPNR